MANPWSDRWSFVKTYIPDNISIIDFGCGNCEVLEHVRPSQYLGVDIVYSADIIADISTPLDFQQKFDLALVLGVLEYLENPDQALDNAVRAADNCVILTLPVKIKKEWRRAFTESSIDTLLHKFYSSVKHHRHGRYILSVCKK